ncbi:unnamed protein product, partial [Medioppia subpectinata]
MDALLVFDPQNNLISSKFNKQFENYLLEFAVENGCKADGQEVGDNQVMRNLLSVFVTPFVVSQRYLSDASGVKFDCLGTMNAVYSKSQEFFLLYIYKESEDKVLMQRRVDIFAQIIKFIFGPLIHCLANNYHLM